LIPARTSPTKGKSYASAAGISNDIQIERAREANAFEVNVMQVPL